MSITSYTFLFFAAAVLLAYYLVPGRLQWPLLLIAGGVFYLWAGWETFGFLVFTAAATYFAARILGSRLEKQAAYLKAHKAELSKEDRKALKAGNQRKNRTILWVYLAVVLGMLAICKACLTQPVRAALKGGRLEFLSLALPLGISFYVFQSVGYVVDVSRGAVKPERNFFRLCLFVSYFPQLVQGPISRYGQLAPNLFAPHPFEGKQLSFGLQRMLWGYFKKLVIADRLAVAVLALRGEGYTGVAFLTLMLFYALQLYADFSGGIDITMGLSEALGIELAENFVRPYFSKNIAEFWRRWHITLGTWMKDYIFYPISVGGGMLKLAGSVRKKLPKLGKRLPVYTATTAVWLVTGIWHGFTANFILWGMLNCLVILVSEELQPLYERFHNRFGWKEKPLYGLFEILRTFFIMSLILACDLFPDVGEYFRRVASLIFDPNFAFLTGGALLELGLTALDYGVAAFGCLVVLFVSLAQEKGKLRQRLWDGDPWLRYGLTVGLLIAVLLLGRYGIGYNASNFIYNQF